MDAYDIFKKLSQGAKFKRKSVNNGQMNKTKKIKIEDTSYEKCDSEIKDEPIDDCYDDIEAEISKEVNNHHGSVMEDRELTILGSIVATDSGIKKKKQKNANKVFDEKKLSMLEQEKINQYRNQNQINVVGRHIASPIKEFKELSIGNDLIENLFKCGYETPTPIQKQAVPIMLQRRQILACAPTGSGKTAAFLLPVIHTLQEPQKKGFRAVVVCPTRELAKQTQRECARLGEGRGFRIHVISKINQGLVKYGPKSNQKFDILVTTPNRLCFLLNQEPPALSLANVEWLIVDEADKLFEKGLRGFREQLDQIMVACTSSQLRMAMFSATQTSEIGRWCRKNMKGLINVTIGQRVIPYLHPDIHSTPEMERNAATDLVEQKLLFVGNESGKLVAFRNLVHKGLAPPVLVFVQSKERAQQLFSELVYDGINVDAIHADRTQTQRDNTVRSFREGKVWVLICTELMARGVDFKGVNLVVNYDFPPSAIAYVHRVGRAGRAGRTGKAITFFTTDDTANLRSIAHVLRQSGCEVPEYMLAIKKRSKKERNKIINREEITTKPKYVREQNEKKRNRFVKPLSATNANDTKVNNAKKVTNIDRTGKKKMFNKKKKLDDSMSKKPVKLKTRNAKKMNSVKKLGKKSTSNI